VQRILDATSLTASTRVDILRNIDGTELTPDSILNMLRDGGALPPNQIPSRILSVDARESTAVRGPHSAVARVSLRVVPEAVDGARDPGLVTEVFLKRCVVADLLKAYPRPAAKVPRDARSYYNEVCAVQ
jgi:hypothetical protein